MSNMSYCRMQNTYGDLRDCIEALEDRHSMSEEEREAARGMLVMMVEFFTDEGIVDYDYDDDDGGRTRFPHAARIDTLIAECKGEFDDDDE